MGAGAGAAVGTRPLGAAGGAAVRGAGVPAWSSAPCALPDGVLAGSCHRDDERGCPAEPSLRDPRFLPASPDRS